MTVSPTHPRRSARRITRYLAVLAVGSTVALSACTPATAGNAAVVGESTLSLSQLTDARQEIDDVAADKGLDAPEPSQTNLQLVGLWVEEELTDRLAAQEGVTVSEGDVDQFLSQFSDDQLAQISVTSGIPPSAIERAARTQLLQVKLAPKLQPSGSSQEQNAALRSAMSELAAQEGVSVNPRFGAFDSKTAQVTQRDDERLSSPAPSDSPSASPSAVLPQG